MGSLLPADCPPPLPPPPPPPPNPAQAKCEFTLGNDTISLKSLPNGSFALTDRMKDRYSVVSPCLDANGTLSPALETWYGEAGKIQLGLLTKLSTAPLPAALTTSGRTGMRLILGGGDALPGCRKGRTLWYDMVCDANAPVRLPPFGTLWPIVLQTVPFRRGGCRKRKAPTRPCLYTTRLPGRSIQSPPASILWSGTIARPALRPRPL